MAHETMPSSGTRATLGHKLGPGPGVASYDRPESGGPGVRGSGPLPMLGSNYAGSCTGHGWCIIQPPLRSRQHARGCLGKSEIENLANPKISWSYSTYDSAMCRLSDSTASHKPLTFVSCDFTPTKHVFPLTFEKLDFVRSALFHAGGSGARTIHDVSRFVPADFVASKSMFLFTSCTNIQSAWHRKLMLHGCSCE